MNRYGPLGAQELRRQGKKPYSLKLIFFPLWTFVKFYILKRGFLDGRLGLLVCIGSSFSTFIKYAYFLFLTSPCQKASPCPPSNSSLAE
jgi:(heptosyl)LPS beta-1,4-glucosyltransferase